MDTEEKWHLIDEFPEYEISTFGRVKRIKTKRILRPGKGTPKYPMVVLCKNKKTKPIRIHRIMAMVFLNDQKTGKEINHIDGNKSNNNLSNLELVTRRENIKHGYDIGTHKPFTKLKENQVLEIMNLLKNKISIRKIAKIYGVNHGAIEGIKYGKSWRHISLL